MPSHGKRDEDKEFYPHLSRRQMMALGLAAGTTGLAGCGGGGDGQTTTTTTGDTGGGTTTTTTTTTTEEGGEQLRTQFRTQGDTDTNPNEWNANQFHPQSGRGMYMVDRLKCDPMMLRAYGGHDDIETITALEDWSHDGCVSTYTLRDDVYWWDGEPITSKDLETQFLLDNYVGLSSKADMEVEFEIVNERTIEERRLTSPIVSDLARPSDVFVEYRDAYWGEWVEKYEDASNSDAFQEVTGELQQLKFGWDTFVEESLGNGLWIPDEWDEISMTLRKNEDHFRSDWTNLESWHIQWRPDSQKRIEAAKNDRVDTGRVFDQNEITDVRKFGIDGGRSITFRVTDNKHIANRRVRQAIFYLFDHEQILEIIKRTFDSEQEVPMYHNGMVNATSAQWLGEDWMEENLIDYGSTAQPEKARERMETAGYTEESGTWVDSEGDPASGIEMVLPQNDLLSTMAQFLQGKLSEFGIEIDLQTTTWAQYFKIWEDTKEFDVLDSWIAGRHPSQVMFGPYNLGPSVSQADPQVVEWPESEEGSCEYSEPSVPELHVETSPDWGIPIRDTFPSEFGADEISGEGETLYPAKWHREMQRNPDTERTRELARKIAWYFNWKAFQMEYYNEIWNYTLNTEAFELSDHAETYSRNFINSLRGHINSKTE